MHIINLAEDLAPIYPGGCFSLACWEEYIRAADPTLADLCLADMRGDISAGLLDYGAQALPVLNACWQDAAIRAEALASFRRVTAGLDERIRACFGRTVEADVILYPGLCSGAGWVTTLHGRDVILLGIEKITELRWCSDDDMRGLIFHELGHVYQRQYGILARECATFRRQFLWQLFTEGVAMRFEQLLMGDMGYFHQDRAGWADWCHVHMGRIKEDFLHDLDGKDRTTQRFFGDWVRYEGHGDVGYYLGARFLAFICRHCALDDILSLDDAEVEALYLAFAASDAV